MKNIYIKIKSLIIKIIIYIRYSNTNVRKVFDYKNNNVYLDILI